MIMTLISYLIVISVSRLFQLSFVVSSILLILFFSTIFVFMSLSLPLSLLFLLLNRR